MQQLLYICILPSSKPKERIKMVKRKKMEALEERYELVVGNGAPSNSSSNLEESLRRLCLQANIRFGIAHATTYAAEDMWGPKRKVYATVCDILTEKYGKTHYEL